MNFLEAVKCMKKGERVRRVKWTQRKRGRTDNYAYKNEVGNIVVHSFFTFNGTLHDSFDGVTAMSDILATDWEVIQSTQEDK